jgi:hypothetical protein
MSRRLLVVAAWVAIAIILVAAAKYFNAVAAAGPHTCGGA